MTRERRVWDVEWKMQDLFTYTQLEKKQEIWKSYRHEFSGTLFMGHGVY